MFQLPWNVGLKLSLVDKIWRKNNRLKIDHKYSNFDVEVDQNIALVVMYALGVVNSQIVEISTITVVCILQIVSEIVLQKSLKYVHLFPKRFMLIPVKYLVYKH